MCTYIDKKATEKMKNGLKDKKVAYAWKVVQIDDGYWFAPFWGNFYAQENSTHGQHISISTEHGREAIHGGVFYLSLTRKLANFLLKNRKIEFNNYDKKFKVVKVSFKPEDIVYVGDCGAFDKRTYEMPAGPDTVCVKAFSFIDKIGE